MGSAAAVKGAEGENGLPADAVIVAAVEFDDRRSIEATGPGEDSGFRPESVAISELRLSTDTPKGEFDAGAGFVCECPRCQRLCGELRQGRELELSHLEMS